MRFSKEFLHKTAFVLLYSAAITTMLTHMQWHLFLSFFTAATILGYYTSDFRKYHKTRKYPCSIEADVLETQKAMSNYSLALAIILAVITLWLVLFRVFGAIIVSYTATIGVLLIGSVLCIAVFAASIKSSW